MKFLILTFRCQSQDCTFLEPSTVRVRKSFIILLFRTLFSESNLGNLLTETSNLLVGLNLSVHNRSLYVYSEE